jgi:hypothetical protein
MRDLESEAVAAVLDPFGVVPFFLTTRYWTVFDKNTRLLPLEGPFLLNRLLWLAVGLVILGIAFWKFDPTTGAGKVSKKKRKLLAAEARQPQEQGALILPRVHQLFGGWASVHQFLAAARMETMGVIKSIPFVVIVLLGVANIWGNSTALSRMFGTAVYPVSHLMVDVINGGFGLFAVIIAAFYAGDLVFRERTLKLNEVSDAMPVPTWVLWTAKASALVAVTVVAIAVAVVTCLIIQTAKGYHNYELSVYAKGLVMEIGPIVLLLAGLAFVLQTFLNNKYLGFFGMMLYVVLDASLPALDLEHNLYRFGNTPPGGFSDMNGWGHFVVPRVLFFTYWTLFIATLLALGHFFWVRGTDTGLRQRLKIARGRVRPAPVLAFALSFAGLVALGGYIFYNTNVLNGTAPRKSRRGCRPRRRRSTRSSRGCRSRASRPCRRTSTSIRTAGPSPSAGATRS